MRQMGLFGRSLDSLTTAKDKYFLPRTRLFLLDRLEFYSRFAWIYDLDGNKIESWQPFRKALLP
jgi:hypothetical protein